MVQKTFVLIIAVAIFLIAAVFSFFPNIHSIYASYCSGNSECLSSNDCWSCYPQTCSSSNDQCVSSCTNQCSIIGTSCAPDGKSVSTCSLNTSTGCNVLTTTACSANQTCSNGTCVTPPPLTVSCSEPYSQLFGNWQVNFTAYTNGGTGDVSEYSWTGGCKGSSIFCRAIFKTPGTKTTTVVVTDSSGKTAKATCSVNIKKYNCCLCLYEDIPQCAPAIADASCMCSFSNPTTCATNTNCQWGVDIKKCFASQAIITSCLNTINPKSNQKECGYDANANQCFSIFKYFCQDYYEQSPQTKKCDVVSTQPDPNPTDSDVNNIDEKTSLIKNFYSQNSCSNFNYIEQEHGKSAACTTSFLATVTACTDCISSNGGFCHIFKSSCSVFANQTYVQILAKDIQTKLCKAKDYTSTVVVTSNQSDSSWLSCKTPETLAVTCNNICTTFMKCSDMPALCFSKNQVINCSNYSSAGVYKNDAQYVCCAQKNSKVSAWRPANPNAVNPAACPGDTNYKGERPKASMQTATRPITFLLTLL